MRYMLLLLSVLIISGCETDGGDDLHEEDVTTVIDHAYACMTLVPVYPLVRALQAGTGTWASIGTRTCAQIDSIVGDTTAFPNNPVMVYLRYPSGGCSDVDARVRDGIVVIEFASAVGVVSGNFRVTSPGLEVSGFKVRFGMHGTSAGAAQEVVIDSSFIWQAGAWSRRISGPLNYAMTNGASTLEPEDDSYSLTHALQGSDRAGAAYTASTSEALLLDLSCRWIAAGTELVVPSGLGQRTLDHGSGSCDGHTVITVGGQSIGLTIP